MNVDCLCSEQQDIFIASSSRSSHAPSCSLTQHITQRTLGSCVFVLSPPNYGKHGGKSRYLLCPSQIIKEIVLSKYRVCDLNKVDYLMTQRKVAQ